MDPDANLTEQRDLANKLIDVASTDPASYTPEQVEVATHLATNAGRLAELVQALDQWIMRGGALPQQWREVGVPR